MSRRPIRFTLLLLASATAAAAQGRGEVLFRRYPFETWRAQGPVTQIHWKWATPAAQLSPQQRLIQRFEVQLETAEVERRRDHGELVFLFEIEDSTGRRWHTRQLADLRRIPADTKAPGVNWLQDFYLLPGTYKLAGAVFDSKTKEHSFLTRELRVSPRRSDPLPQAWRDLPPVEQIRLYGEPDYWYEPQLRSHLNLPVASTRPVQVDIIMNMTLSTRAQGSLRALRGNLSVLIPSLRVLSDLKPDRGTLNITVLDLALKKKWEQNNLTELDWARMREPFASANPGVIDVQSLARKAEMQQFFWDSILDRLKPGADPSKDPLHVVIVLSSPVFLERQYRVEPVTFPKDANRRVYYLQYRSISRHPLRTRDGELIPPATPLPSDDLEHTLKLLDTKVFALISPDQFRKAIATILSDIARM